MADYLFANYDIKITRRGGIKSVRFAGFGAATKGLELSEMDLAALRESLVRKAKHKARTANRQRLWERKGKR